MGLFVANPGYINPEGELPILKGQIEPKFEDLRSSVSNFRIAFPSNSPTTKVGDHMGILFL